MFFFPVYWISEPWNASALVILAWEGKEVLPVRGGTLQDCWNVFSSFCSSKDSGLDSSCKKMKIAASWAVFSFCFHMHFVLFHLCWSCLQWGLNLAPLCSNCEWGSVRQQNQNWMWPFQGWEHEGGSWNQSPQKVSPPGKDDLCLENKLKFFLPILKVFYSSRSCPEENE